MALRASPVRARDRVTNRLRLATVLADVRQIDIERATGISHSQLSRMLNGLTGRRGTIQLQLAGRLADYFGCEVRDLFPLSAGRQRRDTKMSPRHNEPTLALDQAATADAFEDLAAEIRAGILLVTDWIQSDPARRDRGLLAVTLEYRTPGAPDRKAKVRVFKTNGRQMGVKSGAKVPRSGRKPRKP